MSVRRRAEWGGRERVESTKDRAGVGASAAQSGPGRDPLHELDREPRRPSRRLRVRHRGAVREVLLSGTESGRGQGRPAHVEPAAGRLANRDVVGEVDAEKRGLERVVAARVPLEHVEEKVDLGLRRDVRGSGQASGGGARMSPIEKPSCTA